VGSFLAPGLENAQDADFRAEVLGVIRDLQQGGGAGRQQEMIKLAGIVERQEMESWGAVKTT
jgi:hypothetical protein